MRTGAAALGHGVADCDAVHERATDVREVRRPGSRQECGVTGDVSDRAEPGVGEETCGNDAGNERKAGALRAPGDALDEGEGDEGADDQEGDREHASYTGTIAARS